MDCLGTSAIVTAMCLEEASTCGEPFAQALSCLGDVFLVCWQTLQAVGSWVGDCSRDVAIAFKPDRALDLSAQAHLVPYGLIHGVAEAKDKRFQGKA